MAYRLHQSETARIISVSNVKTTNLKSSSSLLKLRAPYFLLLSSTKRAKPLRRSSSSVARSAISIAKKLARLGVMS
jgi:hypothetical protein